MAEYDEERTISHRVGVFVVDNAGCNLCVSPEVGSIMGMLNAPPN